MFIRRRKSLMRAISTWSVTNGEWRPEATTWLWSFGTQRHITYLLISGCIARVRGIAIGHAMLGHNAWLSYKLTIVFALSSNIITMRNYAYVKV